MRIPLIKCVNTFKGHPAGASALSFLHAIVEVLAVSADTVWKPHQHILLFFPADVSCSSNAFVPEDLFENHVLCVIPTTAHCAPSATFLSPS